VFTHPANCGGGMDEGGSATAGPTKAHNRISLDLLKKRGTGRPLLPEAHSRRFRIGLYFLNSTLSRILSPMHRPEASPWLLSNE
jgi:hypothetical protein